MNGVRGEDDQVNIEIAAMAGVRKEDRCDGRERKKQEVNQAELLPTAPGERHAHDPEHEDGRVGNQVHYLHQGLSRGVESPGEGRLDFSAGGADRLARVSFDVGDPLPLKPTALADFVSSERF
jgi:hypothetical protein